MFIDLTEDACLTGQQCSRLESSIAPCVRRHPRAAPLSSRTSRLVYGAAGSLESREPHVDDVSEVEL